jgi:hypothetical protein
MVVYYTDTLLQNGSWSCNLCIAQMAKASLFVGLILFHILLIFGDVNNLEGTPNLFNLALLLLQNVLRILLL